MQARVKTRSCTGATEIAQFPLTIYVLFSVVLLPVLNLVTLLVAGCTAYLATNDLAAKAATQPNFTQALNTMAVEAYTFQSNNLAQFVKMVPQSGYGGCGADLYILETQLANGVVNSSAADQPLSQPISTTNYIYEARVDTVSNVSPLVSLAAIPLLGNIPGLGRPVTLSFSASRPVENPGGWQGNGNGSGQGVAAVQPFARVGGSQSVMPPPTNITWRTPNIYQLISAAGQTPVATSVITVYANNPQWTPTQLAVTPGQTVWIDYQASNNQWIIDLSQSGYGPTPTNADGGFFGIPFTVNNMPCGSVVGVLGSGQPFFLGQQQLNMVPPGSGPLYVACNQGVNTNSHGMTTPPGSILIATPPGSNDFIYNGNSGTLLVRVIIAR